MDYFSSMEHQEFTDWPPAIPNREASENTWRALWYRGLEYAKKHTRNNQECTELIQRISDTEDASLNAYIDQEFDTGSLSLHMNLYRCNTANESDFIAAYSEDTLVIPDIAARELIQSLIAPMRSVAASLLVYEYIVREIVGDEEKDWIKQSTQYSKFVFPIWEYELNFDADEDDEEDCAEDPEQSQGILDLVTYEDVLEEVRPLYQLLLHPPTEETPDW